jgi:tetratricopeptide (TPR) repeat protein
MALGYYGRNDTQQEIAAFTKPDPKDNNVNADELVAYANNVGMLGMVRENGTIDRLKLLLSNGLPVIIETGVTQSNTDGWIAHDKLLVGYDDRQFIFMDPLGGSDQKVAFETMDAGWRALNRRYLIVYPSDKEAVAQAILSSDMNDTTMYTNAVARARAEIEANPQDAFAYFNLGTNLNGLQQYQEAAAAFDRARALGLPWRMMWYQFGPYVAYLLAGRNSDVIALADATLRTANNLEESHYYKGMALSALGQTRTARNEFQMALRYNRNYRDAQRALQGLSTSD